MKIFKNKTRLDFQYIVIEIALVTIGILIAIAIDNWNSDRLTQIEVDDYLLEIHSEIEGGINYQNRAIKRFESMSNSLIRVMKIIERNDIDSIPYLKNIISIQVKIMIYLLHLKELLRGMQLKSLVYYLKSLVVITKNHSRDVLKYFQN